MLIFLSLLLFTACTVDSPLTTTNNWLKDWKNDQNQEAASLLVNNENNQISQLSNQQKTTFIKNFEDTYGQIQDFSVQNAIPLSSDGLKPYNVSEGYEVYYTQVSQKQGEQHLKLILVKIDGAWKIITPTL